MTSLKYEVQQLDICDWYAYSSLDEELGFKPLPVLMLCIGSMRKGWEKVYVYMPYWFSL